MDRNYPVLPASWGTGTEKRQVPGLRELCLTEEWHGHKSSSIATALTKQKSLYESQPSGSASRRSLNHRKNRRWNQHMFVPGAGQPLSAELSLMAFPQGLFLAGTCPVGWVLGWGMEVWEGEGGPSCRAPGPWTRVACSLSPGG